MLYAPLSRATPSVASINLCADQLVVLLADSVQIKTLSNLSQQKAGSYYYQQAQAFTVNTGHSEQILPYQPDLVIAGQYSSAHTISLLRETGLRVETLPIANSLEMMVDNIKTVARWLQQDERGAEVISEIRLRLAALQPAQANRPMAAVYDPNGYTVGKNSIRGDIIERAGWQNAASQLGIESYGSLSLEAMLHLQPDALIESPYSPGTYSRAQTLNRHPALRGAGLNPLIITIPSRMTICAGPWTIDVIEELQRQRIRFQRER